MPDIVSDRPVSGAAIASSWGVEVHDAIEGLQAGQASLPFSASAISTLVTVTFPRPYTGVPVVVATALEASNGSNINVGFRAITATNFQVQARDIRETALTATALVQWLAIGNPA